jgi:hypothetical protein
MFVQHLLADRRLHQDRPPVTTVKSTSNTRIERHWVENNARVTKDIKSVLIDMEKEGLIQAGPDGNPIHLFCISTVTIQILDLRIERMLSAFRSRRINGTKGCIPDVMRRVNNKITPLPSEYIPPTTYAVEAYERGGGHLTREGGCGEDPLADHPDLIALRETMFEEESPSKENIIADLNQGEGDLYRQSILCYIRLTELLANETHQI